MKETQDSVLYCVLSEKYWKNTQEKIKYTENTQKIQKNTQNTHIISSKC